MGWHMFAAAAIAAAIASATTAQTTWHVDFGAPPGGDGSAAAPLASLAPVAPGPGDTVYLTGVSRDPEVVFSGLQGVAFRRWPGRPHPVLRADVPIGDPWSADITPGVYIHNLSPDAPVRIASVVEDWDHNIDTFGRNYGHLRAAGSIAECRATPSSWHYDAPSASLFIHPSDGADPATSGRDYAWCRTGNALEIRESTSVILSGIDAALWCDPTPDNGYAFYMAGARHSIIEDSNILDAGYHSLGFVGSVNEGNITRRVRCRGVATSGIQVVYFAADEDILGGRVVDCDLDAYPLLGVDGEPVNGRSGRAVFAHTTGSARIADLEFRNCRITGFPGSVGAIISVAERTPTAADRMVAATYPVRFVDCTVRNAAQILFEHGATVHVAFERCSIGLARGDDVALWSAQRFHLSAVGQVQTLYAATTIDIDASAISGTDYVAKIHGGEIILNNATVRLDAPASVGFARFLSAAGRLICTQSIIMRTIEGPFLRGLAGSSASAVAATLEFDGAWICQVAPSAYHSHDAFNSADEWLATVDTSPDAILGGYPGVQRPLPGLLVLNPAGDAATMTAGHNGSAPNFGVYGHAYDQRYGAEQFGPPRCAADLNADAIVDGADLGLLLGVWGAYVEIADLNADGVVDGADLGVLLGAWGACP